MQQEIIAVSKRQAWKAINTHSVKRLPNGSYRGTSHTNNKSVSWNCQISASDMSYFLDRGLVACDESGIIHVTPKGSEVWNNRFAGVEVTNVSV